MSLEKCPTCKKRISIEAPSCPNCGHPLEEGWGVVIKEERKKNRRLALIVWLFVIGGGTYMLTAGGNSGGSNKISPVATMSAIEKMELAFQNNPPRDEIERRMTNVLKNHGQALTDDNLNRAGSMLVALRKANGVPEMEILKCMESAKTGSSVKIPEVAALCVTTLK